jgi:hypothetical protein
VKIVCINNAGICELVEEVFGFLYTRRYTHNQSFVKDRNAVSAKFAKDYCPATRWTTRNLPVANTRYRCIPARAASALVQALSNAQALMREIAGQGPEKTLYRGFALVRDC